MCMQRILSFFLDDPFKDKNIPKVDQKAQTDPYKTVFIGRLSYETTEDRLKKEFELFGPVETIRLVKDKAGKSRGYAFCTFKRERDADYAIQKGDGRRIEGHRILVDRELGRTKEKWLPKRLAGGKGGESRRADKSEAVVREVERELRHELREKEEKAKPMRVEEAPRDVPMEDEREPGEL